MLILTGRFTVKNESLAMLLELCHGMYAASRSEEGCMSYNLWADSDCSLNFMFFEEWDCRESLERHFQTPHFGRFMSLFPSMIQGEPVIQTYESAGPQAV